MGKENSCNHQWILKGLWTAGNNMFYWICEKCGLVCQYSTWTADNCSGRFTYPYSSFQIVYFLPQKKIKGWGIFKGLKIEKGEIEKVKKSLFHKNDEKA